MADALPTADIRAIAKNDPVKAITVAELMIADRDRRITDLESQLNRLREWKRRVLAAVGCDHG